MHSRRRCRRRLCCCGRSKIRLFLRCLNRIRPSSHVVRCCLGDPVRRNRRDLPLVMRWFP